MTIQVTLYDSKQLCDMPTFKIKQNTQKTHLSLCATHKGLLPVLHNLKDRKICCMICFHKKKKHNDPLPKEIAGPF